MTLTFRIKQRRTVPTYLSTEGYVNLQTKDTDVLRDLGTLVEMDPKLRRGLVSRAISIRPESGDREAEGYTLREEYRPGSFPEELQLDANENTDYVYRTRRANFSITREFTPESLEAYRRNEDERVGRETQARLRKSGKR